MRDATRRRRMPPRTRGHRLAGGPAGARQISGLLFAEHRDLDIRIDLRLLRPTLTSPPRSADPCIANEPLRHVRASAPRAAMHKYCRPIALGFIAWSYKASPRHGAQAGGYSRSASSASMRACEELGELAEVVGREGADRVGRAQQDGVGGRDGVAPGGREGDQLATPVVGVRLALDKAVRLQLVDDEGRVRGVDAVCLSQLARVIGPLRSWKRTLPRPPPRRNPSASASSPRRLWASTNRCMRAQAAERDQLIALRWRRSPRHRAAEVVDVVQDRLCPGARRGS